MAASFANHHAPTLQKKRKERERKVRRGTRSFAFVYHVRS
jgi:hypothetical protein